MFYSNNNSYMEDLYYYNQIPNNTYMNNPGNAMLGNQINPNFGNSSFSYPMNSNIGFGNSNGMPIGQMNYNQQVTTPMQNLSSLYPSIYRIINPVISRVVSNSNNQIINEDSLNNMVDTVFNIVEGQIDTEEETTTLRNVQTENQTNLNPSTNITSNSNSSSRGTETSRQTTAPIQNSRNNRNDTLLRDLIKILIIKELLSKNQFQRQYVQNPGIPTGYNPFFNTVNF